VRKKLGSQNLVIKFTGAQGFTWGGQMQFNIADYNTLSVNGSFTVVNNTSFKFIADNATIISINPDDIRKNVNFSRTASVHNYTNLTISIGTASFVGTMTLSV